MEKNNEKYASLKLENQLCFPMYACARKLMKLYTPYLKQIGLTYTQYIAMLVLWDKKEATVKELSECLYLDTGTLTPLLQRMERNGYLTRKRSLEDERFIIIGLTEKGWNLRDHALFIPETISKEIHLNSSDLQVLYLTLYRILSL